MAYIRVVSRKGKSKQVNVPVEICRFLDVKHGSFLAFVPDADGFVKLFRVDLSNRPDLVACVPGGSARIAFSGKLYETE